jgi:hypothetical protein
LRKIPRVTTRKYRAGIRSVSARRGAGIASIENMKPDSRNAGRNVASIATCVATSCDRATAEMKTPSPSAPSRKNSESVMRRSALPRNGTSKSATPAAVLTTTSRIPMAT